MIYGWLTDDFHLVAQIPEILGNRTLTHNMGCTYTDKYLFPGSQGIHSFSCLVGKETEERFYERLAECFTEEDVLTSISSAFGVSFSEDDIEQFEKLYGGTT